MDRQTRTACWRQRGRKHQIEICKEKSSKGSADKKDDVDAAAAAVKEVEGEGKKEKDGKKDSNSKGKKEVKQAKTED